MLVVVVAAVSKAGWIIDIDTRTQGEVALRRRLRCERLQKGIFEEQRDPAEVGTYLFI